MTNAERQQPPRRRPDQATAVPRLDSRGLQTVIAEYGDGRVKVYGEVEEIAGRRFQVRGAQRTEIQMGDVIVAVHRNLGQAPGEFSIVPRFSELEVKHGEASQSLGIRVDAETSGTNPLYHFLDGDRNMGTGYGQRMDLRLASLLTGEDIGGRDDVIPTQAMEWVRERLTV